MTDDELAAWRNTIGLAKAYTEIYIDEYFGIDPDEVSKLLDEIERLRDENEKLKTPKRKERVMYTSCIVGIVLVGMFTVGITLAAGILVRRMGYE